jgi:hypothetical protein
MYWKGGSQSDGKRNLIASIDKKMRNENENLSEDKNRLIIFCCLDKCLLFFIVVDVLVASIRNVTKGNVITFFVVIWTNLYFENLFVTQ